MKNKYLFLCGKTYVLLFATGIFLFGSCTQGYDGELWESPIKNSQLQSPEESEFKFGTVLKSDGSEVAVVNWPVVYGAGGYLFNLAIIDDPENPIPVVTDSIIDGCTVMFNKLEDTKYEISVRTLGNEKLNNKAAEKASTCTYSTLIPAIQIPEGIEIASFIQEHLQMSEKEQAFELAAGKTYHLDELIDFGLNTITFRGNKTHRPTIIVGENGGIKTQGGLKTKFINFDCTSMKATGLLTLSENPDESISTANLGYKAVGANQDGFVINNPIIFQECNIKNLKNSLLYGNKKNWSLRDFRVMDCIVQLNNSGSNSIIHLQGASNGLIKNLTIKNSTFYNLVKNKSAYFIRYSNSSNAQPKKIFGENDNSSTFIISHNTFCKTFSNKDFANNMPNTNTLVTNIEYNIFYDVFRLYQIIQNQSYMTTPGNTIWGVDGGTPNSNDTGGRKDKLGNPYATLEDPQFVGPFLQEFDLEQLNGGVNFKPTGAIAVENKAGDPRWYE